MKECEIDGRGGFRTPERKIDKMKNTKPELNLDMWVQRRQSVLSAVAFAAFSGRVQEYDM